MRLEKLLANLGYGSRRDIARMCRDGFVTDAAGNPITVNSDLQPEQIRVEGEPLDPIAPFTILLNKPDGYSCTTEDPGRVIYDLLPERYRYRKPLLSPVGRLDKDTTGLLLMTDDGQLLHRIISPKAEIAKTYEVILDRPLSGEEGKIFASGELMLRSEKTPLKPAVLEVLDERRALLTIREGRYHQVRRMFAAVGNHVQSLRRVRVGALDLGDLPEGEWRAATEEDVAKVFE
ncbi:pseudouridine synthase [Telmatospirillum sp. J64-1]|uniref:pseudouridine synthase n=1 Tax=Telmatospirillum sp. J64-1 TaxID=2502183 RepID=UPI00115CD1D9|nr:pseudouridine synthase [Telmatospirillum sp. J64-1]